MKKISVLLMTLALAATLALLAVPALAQNIVYTGCIKSSDGSLYSVREGTTPMKPCKAKDKQISWNMAGQPGPPGPPGPSLPPWLGIDVNCDEGESIQAALGQQAERLTISISGTCVEEVWIERDDVTLQGAGTNATIQAPAGAGRAIQISGAQRVRLQGLTVIGAGSFTLTADHGASFTAYQLKIRNPIRDGLYLLQGAAATMVESVIEGCQAHGAIVDSGSSLVLQRSQVIDNGREGLFVQGSVLTLWRTNVARNWIGISVRNGRAVIGDDSTILDNRSTGLYLSASHLYVDSCRIAGNGESGINLSSGSAASSSDVIIQGNGGNGIDLNGGSAADLNNVIIRGNGGSGLFAQQGSAVRVGGSTIEGGTQAPGIILKDTCTADVSRENYITGSPYGVFCQPYPSVAQLTWPVPDTVTTNCPISP